MFIEGAGTFLRLVGFDVTVNKNHVVGVIVLHPKMTASGGVRFYRAEMGMVAHDVCGFVVNFCKAAGITEHEISGVHLFDIKHFWRGFPNGVRPNPGICGN